ncbi:MAG: leucine--tRNA ligase [Xanthomonadales bacterium]|nr:leucine--tRNA ligase [Xanthomonadales bacterium]
MKQEYNPQQIELDVQQQWTQSRAYEVSEDPNREKFYCLSMLPYPSGALHMGHVRNYTIGDVISRYQRMLGKNVLQPMGWDAFGLPAENAALKHQTAPAKWTYKNIDYMRQQLQRLGFAYDWSRELATCKPDYYRWEQQMFVRLLKKGMVYRKNSVVNWDPIDQTVLANEQVIDGRGWRSGALVEKKEIPQWFLKITDYAEELLDGLDHLEQWPDAVKIMQRNWIGRSEGADFNMSICDASGNLVDDKAQISVFTTRPDTAFGMTYAVLAPEHPLVMQVTLADQLGAVTNFIQQAAALDDAQRTGEGEAGKGSQQTKDGQFTGAYVLNPFTQKAVPLYIANYVLMGYGSGAIMAVPGQDQRDWDFATAHNLPIIRTVQPEDGFSGDAWTADGPAINSDWLNGLGVDEARERAIGWLENQGLGERKVNYRLHDWGVSRQRYWGCPIPIIYCPQCDAVPVPEDQLPVVLPENVKFSGVKSPIKEDPEWRKTTCPQCGGPAARETDTFDTFMESSWYYARYCTPNADDQLDERANYWLPVDQYIGGIEHAIMHLLYFRFYHKLLRDAGYIKSDEPVTRLLCQGMVVAETFYRENEDGSRHWYNPIEVELEKDQKGKIIAAKLLTDNLPVIVGAVEKMSKSKNNGVDPQSMIDKFGADTVRLFSVFASPPDQSLEWLESGVEGASRFLRRVWNLVQQHLDTQALPVAVDFSGLELTPIQKDMRRNTHKTIHKVGDDLGRRQTLNTAIAACMEFANQIQRFKGGDTNTIMVRHEAILALVQLLSPISPHICQQLWQQLGFDTQLHDRHWPEVDKQALFQDEITVVIQVNGKVRSRLVVAADIESEAIQALALADSNVKRFTVDKQVRKVIYVPGRLVNIVAN